MSECMEKTEGEDNLTLIAKAQSGDRGAMERLISQNMGLVKNIARRFIGRNAEYEDLVQIGTIGMLKAAKSFDAGFGTVFSTYAVPLIIGEIRRFLRDDGDHRLRRNGRAHEVPLLLRVFRRYFRADLPHRGAQDLGRRLAVAAGLP